MTATPRFHVLHEAELDARQNGHRLRAYCPVHGGDHQRSLDVECEGDAAGWGRCHSCSAVVFVPELAPPDVAARILSGERSGPSPARSRPITPADMLRPARARPTPPAATIGPELRTLRELDARMRLRLEDERARAYLTARAIPLDIAQAYGAGYVPADARLSGELARWCDRLVFPLGAPGMDGPGYIGRSLWRWTAELDELAHKALLEETPGAPPRWLKTQAPAGWFNFTTLATTERVVIVEGAFDALALIAAGVGAPVVALAGTAARVDWIPPHVRGVVLALDGDAGGKGAADTLARDLRDAGVQVIRCAPPDDGLGKDWAERWRRTQWDGLAPLADAVERLDSALDGGALDTQLARIFEAHAAPVAEHAATSAPDVAGTAELWALARADPVVSLLEAHGFELVDVRPCA